jgi:hypothetical protein
MHHPPSRRTAVLIAVAIGLLTLAGCKEDEITTAIVPRAAEPEKTRLVGVIYPHGDQTWFFKMMGPESAFEGVEKPFNDFVQSVRFPDKDKPPTWTVSEGWKSETASAPLFAAFRAGDKSLKITVATLPRKKEGELLENVSRWRGQLGLDPVAEADLPALKKNNQIQDVTINGDPATLVDMIGAGPGRKSAKAPALTYSTPDGWVESPSVEAGPVRREAVFDVTDGDQKAEASVTALGGPAGGLAQNVARWCRQIEAPELSPDELNKLPTVTVAGRESPYFDRAGKKGRTLGVIVSRGDKTWFFKLTGPAELVEKQKSNFEAFVKSVKFDGGMGAEQ